MDRKEVRDRLQQRIIDREFLFIHFGISCSSWSILGALNKRTLSVKHPEGDGTLAREVLGNTQAECVCELRGRSRNANQVISVRTD